MNELWSDLRYGLRGLAGKPAFTLLAVLPLALGIAANTAIFSLVNALLLRPMVGVHDADSLVEIRPMQGHRLHSLSYPDFLDFRDQSRTINDLAVWELATVSLSGSADLGGTEPEVMMAMIVSGNYFDVLGTRAPEGRFFLPDEAFHPGVPAVAVLSHGLWHRRFGGDSAVVGKSVGLNGVPTRIVGVAPAGFQGHAAPLAADVWLPIGMQAPGLPQATSLSRRDDTSFDVVGRLRQGASPTTAAAELTALRSRLHDGDEKWTIGVEPFGHLPSDARGPAIGFFAVLMVVVGLVMTIVCVNVAGLLFARALGRSRELAVRLTLGAGRGRLVRQLLTEASLLFVAGAASGVLLARWATRMLMAFEPPLPPPIRVELDLALDHRVLAFTVTLTLVTGLISGLLPALRATRGDLAPALKQEARSGGPATSRWRGVLLAVQTAGTLILLVAAGLFLRSLSASRQIDPGFTVEGVRLVAVDLDVKGFDQQAGQAYLNTLLERVRSLPGTLAAGIAVKPPLASGTRYGGVFPHGVEAPEGGFRVDFNAVTAGYFDTVGIPLLAGREIAENDVAGAPYVAVVNETLARRFWPEHGAVGRRFSIGSGRWERVYEVVGVARDAKYHSLFEQTPLFAYVSTAQRNHSQAYLHWRAASGGPGFGEVRSLMRELDPAMPPVATMDLRESVELSLLPQRLAASVSGVLGVAGLLLAVVGLYGLTAYLVDRRRHEIGVRMALGAEGGDVLRWLLATGLKPPLVGGAVGLTVAALVGRLIQQFLPGLSALDPVTYAGVVAALGGVSFVAVVGPARRALRTQPMRVLREE